MPTSDSSRPVVLIVGAGLGGLTLGAILERTGIDYEIFERSPFSNPVGSAIRLSASVMPMLQQLGLLQHLTAISKIAAVTRLYNEQNHLLGSMDFYSGLQDRFQYPRLLMSRPDLYDMLLEQIPTHKMHYGKKLLSYEDTENGVLLKFSDNSTVEGSILVGADGANSSVRQNLYKQMEKMDLPLPDSDKLPLKYSSISLVGQTRPLDREKYPLLKEEFCNPEVVISDVKPSVCIVFPTAQNTMCWMVIEFLDKETSKLHDNFRTSEWGPEAAEAMAKDEEIRRIVIPNAGSATMGDLVDLTPKELMSKVMLEEKLFKTWTSGRTVLIGDACHKMSPSAGQGAVNAMLDATILANYIESLISNDAEAIQQAFQAYRNERFEGAKAAVDGSAAMMLLLTKGLKGALLRMIMLDPPNWLRHIVGAKTEGYRPQVAFLPRVEDKGSVKSPYQPSLHLPTTTRPKRSSHVSAV